MNTKVYKNTLVTLAAKELGLDGIAEYLEGAVSIAFSYEDVTLAARLLNDFAKDHKKLELKAGIIEGEIYDEAKIKQLATIPSKRSSYCKTSWKYQVSNIKLCTCIKCYC